MVEIGDLTDEVEQIMDEFWVSQYTVPYADSGGDLCSVQIGPPDDPSNPYQWDTDFSAEVDPLTGDVNITLNRPGPYMVKVIRDSAGVEVEEFVELHNQSGHTSEDKDKSARTTHTAKPTADLVLISSSTADNGALGHARNLYPNHELIGSVQDVVTKIEAKFIANGNQKYSVLIIDHGRSGHMSMGDGQDHDPGGFINSSDGTADRDKFTEACSGRITTCTLGRCRVASGDAGEAFLQKLATEGNMTVRGATKRCHWLDTEFYMDKGGTWVTKP